MGHRKANGTDRGSPITESQARIHQASGMVSVQANCTFAEAIELMQQRANTNLLSLDEIASAVVERSIGFHQ